MKVAWWKPKHSLTQAANIAFSVPESEQKTQPNGRSNAAEIDVFAP